MAMKNITHFERQWTVPIILGSILLIAGILMAVYKREALQYILMFVGAMLIVITFLNLLMNRKNSSPSSLVLAVIVIALGIVLLVLPGLVTDVLMALLAIALALYGILMIFRGAWSEKGNKMQMVLSVIIGAISLALGVYAILNLDETADIVMILIGVVVAVIGGLEIVRGLRIYNDYS